VLEVVEVELLLLVDVLLVFTELELVLVVFAELVVLVTSVVLVELVLEVVLVAATPVPLWPDQTAGPGMV
jgi:hypothetical protein